MRRGRAGRRRQEAGAAGKRRGLDRMGSGCTIETALVKKRESGKGRGTSGCRRGFVSGGSWHPGRRLDLCQPGSLTYCGKAESGKARKRKRGGRLPPSSRRRDHGGQAGLWGKKAEVGGNRLNPTQSDLSKQGRPLGADLGRNGDCSRGRARGGGRGRPPLRPGPLLR